MTKSIGSSPLAGSVFAGGLQVGGSATLQGNGSTVYILTGGQYAGYVVNNSDQQITLTDIQTSAYSHTQFIQPSDLRAYSNYIYYLSGSTPMCMKNNLPGITSETPCNSTEAGYATYNANSGWSITTGSLPVGVLWFDGGDVTVNINTNLLVNTIIATGSITANVPTSYSGSVNFYAPAFYPSSGYTCSQTNYPTQLCNNGAFQSPTQFPGNIANILFLAGNNLTLGGGNNAVSNFYGNVISSTGSGGTGSASGKFTGTGTINIVGNIVNANENSTTWLNGNITITLADTTVNGDNIPTYQYIAKLKAMQYL